MLIDDVKLTLRISNTAYDTEIQDLIDSAKSDLELCGVKNINEEDVLIKRCIITYVKANFGWDNPDSEKLNMSYEMLRNHLTYSLEYTEEGE